MQDSTNRKREVDNSGCGVDNDSDYLEVLSPPNKRCVRSAASPILPSNHNNDEDDDDEDAVMLSSNLVNPNIDYPHLRLNCGKIVYNSDTASQFCARCFCHVCDQPAMVCESWAQHCLQIEPVERDKSISTGEVTVLQGSSSVGANVFLQNRRGVVHEPPYPNTPVMTSSIVALFQQHYGAVPEGGGRGMRHYFDGGDGDDDDDIYGRLQRRGRGADSKRITEVLAENLALLVNFTDDPNVDQELRRRLADDNFLRTLKLNKDGLRPTPMAASLKMEGDISDLRLHNSFFVEGIRIGWPFSTILTPQRQMAIHIVKALKRKLHVVLESPTGTGKSAAILCSVLAWQRYHSKCQLAKQAPQPTEEETYGDDETAKPKDTRDPGEIVEPNVVTIIYCSRTHSQVAQMVSSLQKTPYRPRMTILGSRERLCINKELTKGDKKPTNAVLNQQCRDRKVETDRRRKAWIKDLRKGYDDDNPVEFSTIGNAVDESTRTPEPEGEDGMDNNSNRRGTKRLTCQHYQQLTTFRTAMAARDRFIKAADEVNSCCSGGEHTKLGVMDIEDLADFGKNPHRESKIALYRTPPNTGSFGIFLAQRKDGPGCQVEALRPGGVAEKDGRIMVGDWVQVVNGVSTKSWTLEQIKQRILSSTKDPLILTVQREGAPTREDELDLDDEDPYSDHSVCPYYLSRALLPSANLIFAPYNYVLDPAIRRTMSLNLEGSVVVLDEAHNIEDTLCESGSGEYGEIDLCNLISTLTRYSNQKDVDKESVIDLVSGGQEGLSSVAHELLLFLEKLVMYMQRQRRNFETGPGLEKIKQEHVRYHLQDDHAVEISFSGPTGFGLKNKAVGCGPKLVELGITADQCKRMSCLAQSLENHLFGKSDVESDPASEAAMNNLNDIMSRFELASRSPEHFFMAFNMKPNGNMDYATKLEETRSNPGTGTQRMRRQPRALALAYPRTEQQPNNPLHECHHEGCTNKDSGGYIIFSRMGIRHGDMCNGDKPLWECHLTIRLLSPGLLMNDLSRKCRSVILASGSLAPLQSLCAELNLYGPKQESSSTATSKEFPLSQLSDVGAKSNSISLLTPSSQDSTPILKYLATSTPSPAATKPNKNKKELSGRLQVKPKPLEAGHVIDLKKQLLACAIGHFPDGTPLTVSYANYKEDSFFPRLGHALASVIENIPFGGVLVFLPSYSFLNKCIKSWNPTTFGEPGSKTTTGHPEIWNRFLQAKGKVIVEPTGSQEKFDAARLEYQDQIRREKRCLLLAVFRGKMSEGISFNDDNARAVICIGIPYPNSFDRNIRAKKAYNDEQRKFCNNTNLLPGQEWYSQQAYRAIAQALGRCIRHGADYGAVILMDSRQCDDGSPNGGIPTPHRNLPLWMRHTVRTLSMRPHGTSNGGGGGAGVEDPILGGYRGLAQELQRFFGQAPVHSQTVLDKWKLDLETAQNKCRDNEGGGRTFDGVTGQWQQQDVSIPASSTSAGVGSAIGCSSSVVKTEL